MTTRAFSPPGFDSGPKGRVVIAQGTALGPNTVRPINYPLTPGPVVRPMPAVPPEPLRVLVVDDDRTLAETIAESLDRRGHACTVVTSGKAGVAKVADGGFDVVLTDLRMADVDGLAVVDAARKHLPDAEVFVITGYADVKTAVEAMKRGASHYLQKPLDLAELRAVVDKSAERVRTVRDLRRQLDEKFGFEGVVGNSPKMRRVLQLLQAYAPTPATVLILGENGTGKELAARALHANGPRKAKPFAAMNCAALNEHLLDDEMFGHEDGSFTGAKGARKGRFEYAHGGTLFLDEVGDMPASLQAKLLAGAGERRGGADRGERAGQGRCAGDRRHQPRPGGGRQGRQVPGRPVPPAQGRGGPAAGPPRAEGGHPATGVALPEGPGQAVRQAGAEGGGRGVEGVRRVRLAGQRPRAAEPAGQHAGARLRRRADRRRPAGGQRPAAARAAGRRAAGPAGPDHLVGRPLDEVERYYMEKALERTGGNREEAAGLLGVSERTLYRKLQEWKKGAGGTADGD